MLNKQILNDLKPIISDPGWKTIVARLEVIKTQADANFHAAKNYEEFLKTKSELAMAERIYRIFAEPTLLADDGIYKPGIPGLKA